MYFDSAKVHATFFKDEGKTNTDKTIYGNLSVSVKVGEKPDGTPDYENDYYKAYFVGGAYELAKTLGNQQRICITKMRIRNRYVSEKKKNYVSVTIFDFEILNAEGHDNGSENQ